MRSRASPCDAQNVRVAAMRVFTRAWDGARRVGKAVTRKMRDLGLDIGRGVGVGGDESSFGGERSSVWWETWWEDTRERARAWIFEHSSFQRFPLLERLLVKLLGKPEPLPAAPPKPRPKVTGPLGAQPPGGRSDFDAEVARARFEAHTQEQAGLRHQVESSRSSEDEKT